MNHQDDVQSIVLDGVLDNAAKMGLDSDSSITPPARTDSAPEGPIVMRVRKRDGNLQPVDVNKIVNVVLACSTGLKESRSHARGRESD